MRWSVALAACAASLGLGAGLVACIDLFHTTDDVLTACQLDGNIPDCGAEAAIPKEAGAPETSTDFCKPGWSHADALEHAQHACAWLGACEAPIGKNAFGECVFQALLAYDCQANPSHPVRGTRHDLWDCLWQANTCPAIDACVAPDRAHRGDCSGNGAMTCLPSGNADTRIVCVDSGSSPAENCALWGQTCSFSDNGVYCLGAAGPAGFGCGNVGCTADERIHVCPGDGGPDLGIDCSGVGAGVCVPEQVPDAGSWIACAPTATAGDAGDAGDAGASCAPNASATCVQGVAYSCAAGMPERIDCASLLGDAGACNAGPLRPWFDFTSPCWVDAGAAPEAGADAGADAGECPPQADETCVAGTLSSRARGVAFTVRCADVSLGDCRVVPTDVAGSCRAQCGPPP
jgi:hypothetical protein